MVEADRPGPRKPGGEVVTYTHGQTACFSVMLRDETGVGVVQSEFNRLQNPDDASSRDQSNSIYVRCDGGGQPQAEVELRATVEDRLAPGEYACRYIVAYDSIGNYTQEVPNPAPRFRLVEHGHKDHEGPEILGLGEFEQ